TQKRLHKWKLLQPLALRLRLCKLLPPLRVAMEKAQEHPQKVLPEHLVKQVLLVKAALNSH
ncbi:MAG: hypothetical protein AAGB22_06245, partial [Bacteroidota bacterium]